MPLNVDINACLYDVEDVFEAKTVMPVMTNDRLIMMVVNNCFIIYRMPCCHIRLVGFNS